MTKKKYFYTYDEYEAEEQAKLDFDNTDLEVEVIEEQTSEQKG